MLASALQRPFRHAGFAAQGIENAVRRVDAIEILGHLAAQKSLRHGLRWVALDFHRAAFLVHRHQHRARVRTVVRADRVNNAEWGGSSHGRDCKLNTDFARPAWMYTGHAMDCVFCKIAAGEIPSTAVYQDELAYAFADINPKAPVHVLIIPREHIGSLAEAAPTNALCSVT